MRIVVSTHQGNLYNEEVEYVVIRNEDGEFAIMNDHIPVVAVINEGYVKMVRDSSEFFVVIVSGIAEFHDNVISVLAQEAHIGRDKESAKAHLLQIRNERLEKNRQEQVDFTKKEKELREHLRTTKAGNL